MFDSGLLKYVCFRLLMLIKYANDIPMKLICGLCVFSQTLHVCSKKKRKAELINGKGCDWKHVFIANIGEEEN